VIFKKIKAEEQYGEGGYRYVGNATFEPAYAQPATAPPANYGATTA